MEKPLKTSTTHPCMLKYLKNRYETDEEYKKAQIEKSKLRYQKNKELIVAEPQKKRGRPRKIKETDEVNIIANS